MSDAPASAARLSLLALTALALNGIVGVGIFFAPAAIASERGAGAVLPAFLVACAAFLPSLAVFALLARRVPLDGGPVAHARRAFGDRAAFVVGSVASLSALASTAAVLRGLADGLVPAHGRVGALAALVLFGLVSARGLGVSARGWTVLTALKVAAFASILAAPLARLEPQPFVLQWPSAAAVLVAAFCFQGFEVTSMLAGRGAAARAMVAAFLVAALLYAAVLLRGPGALVARLGPLATLSSAGIAFAMVVMTPRYLEATYPGLGARGAWAAVQVLVAALVVADSLAALFSLATLAVVAQYASSALALARLSPRAFDRAVALASLGTCALLATGAARDEVVLFAVVVFAAAVLSRTVTGATPSRHAP